MAKGLPRCMYEKHGGYYYVRENKWHPLGRDLHDALVEYARLTVSKPTGAMDALVHRALEDLAKTIAPNTLKGYTAASKRVAEAFAEFTPQQVKPVHIAQFLDDAKDTPGMANVLRTFLTGMFSRAVRWGIVEINPVRDIKRFKTPKRDRYITADEFAAIHAVASPTLQCLMSLAYITGQRLGDIMKINYADITDAGVFVRQQKTGAKMLISMTPDLDAAIKQARAIHKSVKGMTLFHTRSGELLRYKSVNDQWVRATTKAGVVDANFHDIRAASATDAKAQGIDSKLLLGHTTEASHSRYLRGKETPTAKPMPARKS